MPDQPDSSSIAYLERVLRSALTAGGRAPDPVAGKVVVPLLGMAISIGGLDLASELSTPEPGEAAVYEVRRP
ncbi:MAG TPA: hypothetical protein VHA57_05415, partial [Actinomycetota bacterium]|nr:hypothetical protein [Actinomycetota bacterium]